MEGIRLSNEMKIIPNDSDLLVKIESDLKYDNLFNLIKERDQLKKELYNPNFISALEEDIHRWYSVAEAGRVLGGDKPIPPSSLTYYIDNLQEYIIPDDAPSNKYIRLNYLSLVKIKMVLLLKDEFRLNGIKAELGITGTPKTIIPKNSSEVMANEMSLEEIREKLDRYEAMNEMLWGLLVEKGEDGQPQLKKPLQSLLASESLLLEDKSSISQKLTEQDEIIEKLKEENEQLKERIEKNEESTKTINKQIEELNEVDKKRIQESEDKFIKFSEKLKARQQAEEEWDKQGVLKKLWGNRSEYVAARTKAILESNAKNN